ncbi:chromate efflux transporter [Novosphingobium kaempferiae]|uniref:chromate efflux transporter n=1 Tax=Novosphingobium kaempferiae TaxID=2896849 RepID=UPI001E52E972|nr:chromate efflux transporter [Novosphingobium kaempferiae]
MTTNIEASPPRITLPALFLKFLRFGCLAFGGPVAQIAMVRQALVEEERWISPARFNRLLAIMQVLPGPEAHELCVHMGMMARGRVGGLLAGLGFMLPGFVLMLLAGWAYRDWIVGSPGAASAFLGVQIVVLAIIARAVHRIGGHVLEDRLLILLALLSFVATLASVPFWLPLVAAGLAYGFAARRVAMIGILVAAALLAVLLHGGASTHVLASSAAKATVPLLFIAGLKGGLLTFGGAYTAIPYVRGDTVGRGWLTDGSFLDGVALAGVLPAPLVIFATFAGYVVGGVAGAVAITAGMFLPAFAFSMIFFERLEAIVENPALHRILAGVAAAVVGVIAATLLQLGAAVLDRTTDLIAGGLILAVGLIAVWRLKGPWVTPVLVIAAAVAGLALTP